MSIKHGIEVTETPTNVVTPKESTAGLQVVFGTAPVNLAADPYNATNQIMIAYSFKEAVQKVGYCDDFENYTLCQAIDYTFRVKNVGPIVLINVLDPKKHTKVNAEKVFNVANGMTTVDIKGILMDKLVVKDATATTTYKLNEDYVATFDDNGYVVISLVEDGAAAEATKLSVTSTSIDPTLVTVSDIIGGVDITNQKETGLELIRQVFPKLGLTAGLISAPGWSHDPSVSAVMEAKCENINGLFKAMCLIDIDTTVATTYDKVKEQKELMGVSSPHTIACWPLVRVGTKKYFYSAAMSAITADMDADNKDIPYHSPSNKDAGITGTILADGTEVSLDMEQANHVNSFGVVTAINMNGWKTWGNYTAAFPFSTDVKDIWICVRRMLTWWENSFILTFFNKVDDLANTRLIKNITDTENIRGNSYTAQNTIAGLGISFREEDNPITDILAGKIKFKTYYAFYTPAQDIENDFEFDPTILQNALFGGEE